MCQRCQSSNCQNTTGETSCTTRRVGTEAGTSERTDGRTDGERPFSRHIGCCLGKRYTEPMPIDNRDIHPSPVSIPARNSSAATRTFRRGIVRSARLLHNALPSSSPVCPTFRSSDRRRCLSTRPGRLVPSLLSSLFLFISLLLSLLFLPFYRESAEKPGISGSSTFHGLLFQRED